MLQEKLSIPGFSARNRSCAALLQKQRGIGGNVATSFETWLQSLHWNSCT